MKPRCPRCGRAKTTANTWMLGTGKFNSLCKKCSSEYQSLKYRKRKALQAKLAKPPRFSPPFSDLVREADEAWAAMGNMILVKRR